MQNTTPDQAAIIRDYFLPVLESERTFTRVIVQHIPESDPAISDLAWYVTAALHTTTNAICDGKFSPLPAKPEGGIDAMLKWDDDHFAAAWARLKSLSGEDLLRPVEFGGFTRPAVEYFQPCLSNLGTHRGRLIVALELARTEPAIAAETGVELSDTELAAVAGGASGTTTTVLTSSTSSSTLPGGGSATVNYVNTLFNPPSPPAFSDLGATFFAGGNSNSPVGGLSFLAALVGGYAGLSFTIGLDALAVVAGFI